MVQNYGGISINLNKKLDKLLKLCYNTFLHGGYMTSFFMFLLMACPVAHAEVPKFTTLKKGEEAPFEGRLFNDEALAIIIVDKKFENKECELRVDYEVDLSKSEEKYKYDILYAKCEADDIRLNELINIKEDENAYLRKQLKPPKSSWWLAGGFVTGVATAIGIMHVVK